MIIVDISNRLSFNAFESKELGTNLQNFVLQKVELSGIRLPFPTPTRVFLT